jgi:hypothetical protein
MTVCAGACALSATATTYVSDSFEATDGALNKPINQYKMVVTGGNNEFSNRVWTSIADDASVLIASDAANTGFATTTRPMATNMAFVLKLDTNGQPLTRAITNSTDTVCSFASVPVYVDTLIQFTPSEDVPTIETGTKVAIYVNVNSNLVVYHKTDMGYGDQVTNSVFTSLGLINPTNWYRLTIQVGQPTVGSACQIWLDHQLLANATTYGDTSYDAGTGPWFRTVAGGSTLSTVAFQGTGAVDELVVSTDVPSYGAQGGIMLTLSFGAGVSAILTNGAPVGAGSVTNGSTVTIQCLDWYQVASITGATYPEYNGDLSASNQLNSATVTLTATESTNVAVTAEQYTGSVPAGFGLTGDIAKLAAWAVANNKTQAQVIGAGSAWLDDYLLNTPPDTNAQLKINTITYNAATEIATITVGATTTTPAVNFTSLNGTLVVYTAASLADTFTLAGTFTITGTSASTVTVTVPLGSGNFIKAVVQ